MATVAKPSQRPRTESCAASGDGRRALVAVVREHHGGEDAEIEAECERLLAFFS